MSGYSHSPPQEMRYIFNTDSVATMMETVWPAMTTQTAWSAIMEKATSIALMEAVQSAGMGPLVDKATLLASMETTKALPIK